MTDYNLPSFNGVNDIAAAAEKAIKAMGDDAMKGENAIWHGVEWVAAFAAQEMQNGMFTSGEWMADPKSANYTGFIARVLKTAFPTKPDKSAGKVTKNAYRAKVARMERAAKLFLAFLVLSDRHQVSPNYAKRTVPGIWYMKPDYTPVAVNDAGEYAPTTSVKFVKFMDRNATFSVTSWHNDDPESVDDFAQYQPNESNTVRAALGTLGVKRGSQETTEANAPDVSDASVKASADVLASRLARDGGSVTGEAADALESVYAALVANDATWSLLVALRQKHEREAQNAESNIPIAPAA